MGLSKYFEYQEPCLEEAPRIDELSAQLSDCQDAPQVEAVCRSFYAEWGVYTDLWEQLTKEILIFAH